MSNKKATKRALLTSVMALAMCVVMLVGTTFAWFTDTAKTSVNKIQAGKLDIELVKEDGETPLGENDALSWVKAEGHEDDTVLWEPNCTYELAGFQVKNAGNLAVKYKVVLNATNIKVVNGKSLLDVIDWTVKVDGVEKQTVTGDLKNGLVILDGEELLPEDLSGVISVTGHMDENAGNDYQDMFIDGFGITVYATQAAVEYDSFDNTYDENAEYPVYPAGVTEDSFTESKKAVDSNGNFYESFKDAMESVEDGGALYFKEESTVDFGTHLDVTKSVTIYGNGADFSGKDISIGTYAAPENGEATVNIYNTKNLVVWGQPVGTRADVWNVNFYNCTNDGHNLFMYRGAENGVAEIKLTMTNCVVSGFTDSIVHTTADGSIVIKNCTFTNNCAPVNIAHKQAGALTVTVEDCTFINCGKVDAANDYFAPARFVNNSATGTLTVDLKNNTFTGTIGTNGDILLGDYRPGKESHALTANIVTTDPVMVKSSADAAYSCNGDTITLS